MLLTLVSLSLAAPCDAKALSAALAEASPASVGQGFVDLAACDPVAAKAVAATAFEKVLAGPTGDAAALTALSLGQAAPVRSWLARLESDDRASALNKLGRACDKPGVISFWTDSATALGEKFWTAGWYTAMDACRVPDVQNMLQKKVIEVKSDRAMFSALLGTYATNAGAGSIAMIQTMAETETDPLVFIDLIKALPSAGGVGAAAGPDIERLRAATAALNALGPKIPERAFPEARKVYLALGDEVASDQLVALRYKSLLQDNKLLYGVIAIETATCKKGDLRLVLHAAPIWDAAHTWPDQMAERVKTNADLLFEPNLAETCKGTGTVKYIVPEAPFPSMPAYTGWVAAERATLERANPGVTVKIMLETDPIAN